MHCCRQRWRKDMHSMLTFTLPCKPGTHCNLQCSTMPLRAGTAHHPLLRRGKPESPSPLLWLAPLLSYLPVRAPGMLCFSCFMIIKCMMGATYLFLDSAELTEH